MLENMNLQQWSHAQYMRQWRKTHKLTKAQRFKDNCRSYAGVYKRRGKLIPEPCASCSELGTQMHYADYSKPLEVIWMCRTCHLRHHAEIRELEAIALLLGIDRRAR